MILIEGKRKPVQPETLADELKQKQLAAARPWTGQDGRIHQYVFPGSVAEQEMQKKYGHGWEARMFCQTYVTPWARRITSFWHLT